MPKHQTTQDLETEKTKTPALPAVRPVTEENEAQLDADAAVLAAEGQELTRDFRIGDDLRCKKGIWTKFISKDEEKKISATASFVVDVNSYRREWIEWRDRKPVHKIGGRPIDGFVSPRRERLGDNDQNEWPRDGKGTPSDPWQENFSVVMRDLEDGRLCTWTTQGSYGPAALGALLRTYARDRKNHPGMMPAVLLSSETKQSPNYGDIVAPLITIVDWKEFGADASPPGSKEAQPAILPRVQEVLPPKAVKQSLGRDMDDEIPF
jgi:hypothetical protein